MRILQAHASRVAIVIMQNVQKADLPKTKVNATKIAKVRVDRNKLHTGKELGLSLMCRHNFENYRLLILQA